MHFTVRISGRKPYESNCSKLDAKRKHVEPSFNAATSALDARSRRFQESGALRTPQVLISNRQKAIQRFDLPKNPCTRWKGLHVKYQKCNNNGLSMY